MSDQSERIEELESEVERLEATVQGLTEELVEVHDRLETLEDGETPEATETGRGSAEGSRVREEESDEAKGDEADNEDETGGDSDVGDDIIVA
ncbi:DUF7518 family protein [Halorussus halobius]|uniref:DUF7518 family protein n=1 Tax=Halorussus halobius TaxID=1710537 RepID=UPI00109220D3|nr:bZIP transcription factor [Halorussus halobius]